MTRVCILSKIIIDTISGAQRLGGGGVQAAVGVKLAAPDAACTLVAPVGVDFDAALLDGLREGYGVQMCVEALAHVPVTPGETIWYEGETMRWDDHGWEGWAELCAWQPVLPQADAYHVIVEGGGDGEVRAAQAALAAAAARGEQRPWLSVEPVMHEVRHAEVAGLSGPPAPRTTCRPVEPRALSLWPPTPRTTDVALSLRSASTLALVSGMRLEAAPPQSEPRCDLRPEASPGDGRGGGFARITHGAG